MRWLTFGVVALSVYGTATAGEPPLAERYLHAGELAKGQQALEAALAANPKDDQVRFGLGVVEFVRGVERLGQSLHEYGCKPEDSRVPFLRLPVPKNDDPVPIRYVILRRILDDFSRDLAAAEATLAGITDDKVKLPLRLAGVRLDFAGDGRASDRFLDVLRRMMSRQQFGFLADNPDFLVCFDRGDVAWLRAYCHLLMGMVDFYLAFDTEREFNQSAETLFAKPKLRRRENDDRKAQNANVIALQEPARLGRFRRHLIKVAELNRETWRFIRAESDDDHEWLPNSKQKGVLGMPVQDKQIDAWLAMMNELAALLDGKRTLPKAFGFGKNGKGLNLKTFFDDPPEKIDLTMAFFHDLPGKYYSNKPDVDFDVVIRGFSLFENSMAVAYAAWFN